MKWILIFSFFISVTADWSPLGDNLLGENPSDRYGWDVSLSSDGTIIAIGSPLNTDGGHPNAGHVRVFNHTGGNWTQMGQDITGAARSSLGGSVSLNYDGTILAVGTTDSSTRIYTYSDGQWESLGGVIPAAPRDSYISIKKVSLSSNGTIVAIGDRDANGVNGVYSGHVRVYKFSMSKWTQLGADIDGEAADDYSGVDISLNSNGTILAVGAYANDENGTSSGHVRVYEWGGTTWDKIGQDIDGEKNQSYNGYSVSINAAGDTVASGSWYTDDGTGAVNVWKRLGDTGSTWTRLGETIRGQGGFEFGSMHGHDVSLNAAGDVVAIGAPNYWHQNNSASNGTVTVWKYSGIWEQIGQTLRGSGLNDDFGYSVSMDASGSILATGARLNDENGENSGHVRVFRHPTASPTASPVSSLTYSTASPTASLTASPTAAATDPPTPVADVYLNVTVAVTSAGKNVFVIDGVERPILRFDRGKSYAFISYVPGLFTAHPLHVGLQRFVDVDDKTPSRLRYACSKHEGMGNMIVVGTDATESSGAWVWILLASLFGVVVVSLSFARCLLVLCSL